MARVSVLRDGVAARLRTIDGLRVYDTLPGTVEAPAAVVIPGAPSSVDGTFIRFDGSFGRGHDDITVTIVLIVGTASDRSAQELLDEYLSGDGEQSVKAAVEGDETLGGVAYNACVVSAHDYGLTTWADVPYLGARLRVDIVAPGLG
jgi:hypothetical protein